jgi:hypothetical protein
VERIADRLRPARSAREPGAPLRARPAQPAGPEVPQTRAPQSVPEPRSSIPPGPSPARPRRVPALGPLPAPAALSLPLNPPAPSLSPQPLRVSRSKPPMATRAPEPSPRAAPPRLPYLERWNEVFPAYAGMEAEEAIAKELASPRPTEPTVPLPVDAPAIPPTIPRRRRVVFEVLRPETAPASPSPQSTPPRPENQRAAKAAPPLGPLPLPTTLPPPASAAPPVLPARRVGPSPPLHAVLSSRSLSLPPSPAATTAAPTPAPGLPGPKKVPPWETARTVPVPPDLADRVDRVLAGRSPVHPDLSTRVDAALARHRG